MKTPMTPEIMAYLSERGRLGAAGRVAATSPRKRKEIARKAAKARWAKARGKDAA